MRNSSLAMVVTLGCGLVAGCNQETETTKAPAPRPVAAIELREIDPVKPLQLTGSVEAWKEQDVAFEVDGRVAWIVEMGTQLKGRWEENGEVVVEGSRLALLDSSTYEAAFQTAQAEADYARINLEQVIPAKLAEAKANLANYQAEFDRIAAIPEAAVQSIEPIRAQADLDMAIAQATQAEAGLRSGEASLARSVAQLRQAGLDLEHATLFAPFAGEVSRVFVEAGGYVHAGQSVAHVVMMDPIKVDLAVSPELAKRVKVRARVQLFLPGEEEPISAVVYEKATVADPETRTFRISIMTRNQRDFKPAPDPTHPDIPRVTRGMSFERERMGDASSPYIVEENHALRTDDEGWYVWGVSDRTTGDAGDYGPELLTLRKFRVTPGERRLNFLGLYLFRELIDIGELVPGTLIAFDVPERVQDGDQVLLAQKEWRLQPGQLISVVLRPDVPAPGIYVPMNAIKPIDSESGEVFVVVDGRARQVKVRIADNVGALFRIEPIDPADAGLVAVGSSVITDHVHFLQDAEPVRIVKMVEVVP